MHHTVVLSDIHLCEVEPDIDLWMRYRQRPHSPAAEIAAMLAALCQKVGEDQLTLVLNGDVFDFDAPRVIGQKSVFHDLPRTAANAVAALRAILADHAPFVHALGGVLARGHRVVFVSGNHDVQLTLPDVRAVLRAELVEAARRELARHARASSAADVGSSVLFRAWFYKTDDGILIEHGHQYDAYCAYRYPMAPLAAKRQIEIQPTMGSLATRLLVSRMGYFNPHVDSSYMLSAFGYIAHWIRYYLFSRHSLLLSWVTGSLRALFELARRRRPGTPAERHANIVACAEETGAPVRTVARHARLFAPPSEDRLGAVARELWLDRAALLLFSVAFAGLWVLLGKGAAFVGAAVGPALIAAYERVVPKVSLESTWQRIDRISRLVGRVHRARAVVFGHTHHARGAWEDGRFFGNCGSWSAAFHDLECTVPVSDERPLVWLTSAPAAGRIEGGLVGWRQGRFEARTIGGSTLDACAPAARPLVDAPG